jgi:hypothetical protein
MPGQVPVCQRGDLFARMVGRMQDGAPLRGPQECVPRQRVCPTLPLPGRMQHQVWSASLPMRHHALGLQRLVSGAERADCKCDTHTDGGCMIHAQLAPLQKGYLQV